MFGYNPLPSAVWKGPLVIGVAVLIGFLVARWPQAALILAAGPAALLTLKSGHLRLLVVTVGGLLVFNSSSGVTSVKLLYFAVLALCAVAAWRGGTQSTRRGERFHDRQALGLACSMIVLAVVVSFPVAILNDHPISLWARDAVPYAFLGVVPILAADAARHVSTRFLVVTFFTIGTLSAISLVVDFVGQRGLATLPIEQLFFGGLLLPVALYSYACARVFHGRRREAILWAVVAGFILAALFLSGARTGLLMLAAPLAILIFYRGRGHLGRSMTLGLVGAALIILVFRTGGAIGIDTERIEARISDVGAVIAAPTKDASLSVRLQQHHTSWKLFKGAPITGVGPGHVFKWEVNRGSIAFHREGIVVDSSVSTLAKFGLIGALALLGFLYQLVRMLRCVNAGPDPARAGLIGLAAFSAVLLLIGNPIENKGLPLGLLFLLALMLKARKVDALPATGASVSL
jgi:hypothetical protein